MLMATAAVRGEKQTKVKAVKVCAQKQAALLE